MKRDTTWTKIAIFSYRTCIRRPPPSEYCNNTWCGKTRAVWLSDCEKKLKIRLLVSTEYSNATDTQTDGQTDGHRVHEACIGRAAKNDIALKILTPLMQNVTNYMLRNM